ncbi:MAG: phosphate acyltransferase PlsX [Clostridia bacterium]|nr:phosphate acyltransferase PlsX [Clostridia bacterium]
MRIIVDVMGGDNAPHELVKGVVEAAERYTANYILVGDKPAIEAIAAAEGYDLSRFEIVHTEQVITMEDDPISVVRAKSDSSMSRGLHLLAEGQGDAFVSAGNTGALFTGATLIVRKIKGIQRAAIASVLPLENPVLLLDSGANLTVTPDQLVQFGMMGSIYMQNLFNLSAPRVGLLNNGAEACKGTPLQVETYQKLLADETINFVGNIEGNRVPRNVCDVLVTDGFSGNIVLKYTEGMGKLMLGTLKGLFKANAVSMMSALLVKKGLGSIKERFDASNYGGAPFLGISRPVIKSHGSSKAKEFRNAIHQAIEYVNTGVTYDIARALADAKEKKAEAASAEGKDGENG